VLTHMRIIVIGAGIGGLAAALPRVLNRTCHIALIV
jgi:cation diffusion facilitator CzcD-associated flavoprotein CzcO